MRSSVRPVDVALQKPLAGMVISGSDPNLIRVLESTETYSGFSDPDQTIMRPFKSSPSHTPTGSIHRSRAIAQAAPDRTGSRYSSCFVVMAQIARAILLAKAMATSILGLRASIRSSQLPGAGTLRLAQLT